MSDKTHSTGRRFGPAELVVFIIALAAWLIIMPFIAANPAISGYDWLMGTGIALLLLRGVSDD